MKFLHTSDWHIGKLVHGIHMTEDQKHILNQLVAAVEREKPDAIFIAGDIYDRSVPPVEAVVLVNDTLNRLVQLGCKVFIIPGNHDSAQRLGFGKEILKHSNVFIADCLEEALKPISFEVQGERVSVYLTPFLEPAIVRYKTGDDSIKTHDDVFGYLYEQWQTTLDRLHFNVLLAHGFFGKDSSVSESERPLAVGGTEIITHDRVDLFDYVALGHLHKPQKVALDHIRYSGSLLKYSFSEANQVKGITWIRRNGSEIMISQEQLHCLRDMRIIEGELKELLNSQEGSAEDYLMAVLTDKGDLYEPLKQLRTVYPNILKLVQTRSDIQLVDNGLTTTVLEKQDMKSLFESFYNDMYEEPLSDEEETFISDMVIRAQKEGGV
ncbi:MULTISPECIES: exonuclease SbcCD subunit D [unclassified Fusibacter]|uniref:exonuclease SbcCD subunit D n=1 Tax=unclassified Fusibacter TaxID=2624464 RepID=UPI0013E8F862|nr:MULTISPECIES: exonuclease SbcCD subunit D [unclassified Fusibacter]MCK8058001.1 exonuclease SbcCD subunit D [Fusibacter sp. A2]NPE20583.1 exonuclease SbcCD subunit D [Fusibacter sp. A1]